MSRDAEVRMRVNQAAIAVTVSGIVVAVLWMLITFTSVLQPSAGWVILAVFIGISWLQLVTVNRIFALDVRVWGILVVVIGVGVVAFALSLVGVSSVVVGLLAGVGAGGLLVIAGLTARYPG